MPSKIKETMYFSDIYHYQYSEPGSICALGKVDTINDYESLFVDVVNHQTIGEASVPYLYYYKKTIPNIIKTFCKDIKIIIILRNPVDRAYSNYMHHIRDGTEPLSFEEALMAEKEREKESWWRGYQYRDGGRYYNQVEAYINT
jgi:hypothetical protein